ncbi:MAG: arginyltransferase [Pseudomonadota bacterium]
MTDQSLQFPRFFVTAPAPCPYLPGREERKVFTELVGADADDLSEALGRVGFRRSQTVAYRPACENCNACVSVRVIASEYVPSSSMRRVLKRNADVIVSEVESIATMEQYHLLKRYLGTRHADGGMADMDFDEYAEMVEHSPVTTRLFEYRLKTADGDAPKGELIATCLTDILSDGLSMVYSFYDIALPERGLGNYVILNHTELAQQREMRYVYLGYWIEQSEKMRYKTRFQPMERLGPGGWVRMQSGTVAQPTGAKKTGRSTNANGMRRLAVSNKQFSTLPSESIPPVPRGGRK